MDYQGNTNKDKENPINPSPPDKQIEKIITGNVVQKPKGIGRKFKDIFFGGDFKDAVRYVTQDVLLPALRNTIVDVTSRGIENIVYGESRYHHRSSSYRPRIQYNNPMRMRDPRERSILMDQPVRTRQHRRETNDIILSTRGEAESVLERLTDIIDKYDVASLADLYALLGLPTSHIDNKWGWAYLGNVEIRQIREGYLIDLPAVEEI